MIERQIKNVGKAIICQSLINVKDVLSLLPGLSLSSCIVPDLLELLSSVESVAND